MWFGFDRRHAASVTQSTDLNHELNPLASSIFFICQRISMCVCVCLKAEEFESKAHGLLEWLTDAERHLRYQGSVQDLAEVLEQQLGDHQVQSAIVSLYVNN